MNYKQSKDYLSQEERNLLCFCLTLAVGCISDAINRTDSDIDKLRHEITIDKIYRLRDKINKGV